MPTLELTSPALPAGHLAVAAFTGHEAMSELFRYEILLTTPAAGEPLPAGLEERLLGQPARLAFQFGAAAPRVVHGMICSVSLEADPPECHRPAARLTLVPRLWLATQRRQSRIFQDLSIRQVIDQVLAEWAVPARWDAREVFGPRTYCTQYDETDFELVARLLAEEGVYFHFEHRDGSGHGGERSGHGDELVLGDGVAYPAVGAEGGGGGQAPPGLHFARREDEAAQDAAGILDFALREVVRPASALLSGFEPRTPALAMRAAAQLEEEGGPPGGKAPPRAGERGAALPSWHGHHPRARYESLPQKPQLDSKLARKALEQLRRDVRVGEGRSRHEALAHGHAFRLVDHPVTELDGDYVLVAVEHQGRLPGLSVQSGPAYQNRFRCVPAEVRYRPPVQPRRLAQVAETATVVGTGAEEIETDESGRVRLRFHWDLEERAGGPSSCWIRVAQPWAGPGWGSQFIPRVGTEVLVTFLRGDPDDPVVTGCLFNGATPSSHLLPQSKSRSGFRTSSTPGGHGYNELSFEDTAGQEQVHLHAQRDLDQVVGNDRLTQIRRHESLVIQGGRTELVGLFDVTRVLGFASTAVAADLEETVGGARRLEVRGGRAETVHGPDSRDLKSDQSLRVEQGRSVVVKGFLSTQVGTKARPSEAVTSVDGRHTTYATEGMRLTSEQEIVLECGGSRLVIGPEEVRIETKKLTLKAEEAIHLEAKGPLLDLTDKVELDAKAIALFSQGASLELKQNADLNGAQVNLNGGGGAAALAAAAAQGAKLKPLQVKLHDDDMKPFAGKSYRLVVGDLSLEGTTGGDGGITQQVPAEARVAQVRLWLADYPDGPTLSWPIELTEEPLPPPDGPAGAVLRLRTLGYYVGELVAELTPEAEAALRAFQGDYQLEPNGKLDGQTAAKLKEIQGA